MLQLVHEKVFDRFIQRSLQIAEGQAQNSFHCKTPNCPGWLVIIKNTNTDNVNINISLEKLQKIHLESCTVICI